LTPELRATYGRIRSLIFAPFETATMQVREEYHADPEQRRVYARDLIDRLINQRGPPPREHTNYDSIRMLLSSDGPVATVLNNALSLLRSLLARPSITEQEKSDYQNLEKLLEPSFQQRLSLYRLLVEKAVDFLEAVLKRISFNPEREFYERLLMIACQSNMTAPQIIKTLLCGVNERLADRNLSSEDRKHYQELRNILNPQQSYLQVFSPELFMRILGFSLPRAL
jgi:hypothetical protein